MKLYALLVVGIAFTGTEAMAGSFGVSLSANGSSGDACNPPYSNEEGFGSGNLSNPYGLTYSGAATGFDNASGCQNSPVVGTSTASGSASLGVLKLSTFATETINNGLGGGANIIVGWNDTFTALTSGNFLITLDLNVSLGASPACTANGNGPASYLLYNVNEYGPYEQQDYVHWDDTNCTGDISPTATGGSITVISTNLATMEAYLSAGQSFTVVASLQGNSSLIGAQNASAFVDAGDTAIADVVGLNGATYSTASGTVYDATDAPEPSELVMMAGGLVLLGKMLRRRGSIN
jgi:hypothetical protein